MGGIGSGRRQDPVRVAEVIAMRRSGSTLKEIGEKFDLTRERIRQICAEGGLPGAHGFQSKTYLNQADIEPFMAKPFDPICVLCRQARTGKKPLCAKCHKHTSIVRNIKSRLRAYRKTSNAAFLNMAIWLIRKHAIKPSDLEIA